VQRNTVAPYSHLHVRVVFRPSELGRADYIVRLENHGNDESLLLKIHTVVIAAKRKVPILLFVICGLIIV
jgi:hypothetical protein